MLKIAAIVWIILGTVLAGSAVTAVLATPSWADQALRYIPIAGLGGYLVAVPFAFIIAARIQRTAAG